MSDTGNFGFAKLVPGFDFLQNLTKGASTGLPQMPSLSSWIAPTLNIEELEKRIAELKAVHFWLDQNSKALSATIQALEVQKMTVATLQGMNMNMGELASSLRARSTESMTSSMQRMGEAAAAAGEAVQAASVARRKAAGGKTESKAEAGAETRAETKTASAQAASGPGEPQGSKAVDDAAAGAASPPKSGAAAVDPLQWWGSLTQQFQQIAAGALKDVAQMSVPDAAGGAGGAAGKPSGKRAGQPRTAAASGRSTGAAGSPAPAKRAAKKATARKAPARKAGAKP